MAHVYQLKYTVTHIQEEAGTHSRSWRGFMATEVSQRAESKSSTDTLTRLQPCTDVHYDYYLYLNCTFYVHVLVTQSCPTLCNPINWSPPGSSIHGILQARVLEWVAISFSRESSKPRDQTRVSQIPGRCFNLWATREAPFNQYIYCLIFCICNILNEIIKYYIYSL